MADVRTALVAALAADAGIISILGSPATNRIFSPVLPAGTSLATTPAVTIQQFSFDHLGPQLGGPSKAPARSFQVSTLAERVSDAESLSTAVVTALDGLQGTFDTVFLRRVRYVPSAGFDDYDPETQTLRVPLDFEVFI